MSLVPSVTDTPTITDLPCDVLWTMFEDFAYENDYTCSMKLFGNLSMVSRLFRDMCSTNRIWKIIYTLTVKNKWIVTPQSIYCKRSSVCYYDAKKVPNRSTEDLIGGSTCIRIESKQQYDEFFSNPLHCNYDTCHYKHHDMVMDFVYELVCSRWRTTRMLPFWSVSYLRDCMCCPYEKIAFTQDTLQLLKEINDEYCDLNGQWREAQRRYVAGEFQILDRFKPGGEGYKRLKTLRTKAYCLVKSELKAHNDEWIKQGGNGGHPMGDNICRNPKYYLNGSVKFPDNIINRGSYKDAVLKKKFTIANKKVKSSKKTYDSLTASENRLQEEIDKLMENKKRVELRKLAAKEDWMNNVTFTERLQDGITKKKGK
jgi:hypothetical protein